MRIPGTEGWAKTKSPYYSSVAFTALAPVAFLYSFASQIASRMFPYTFLVHPLPSTTHLQGKVAIVTGSNTGIGYETAKALVVDYGMTVVLACRSRDKAEQAIGRIQEEQEMAGKPKGKAIFLCPLDLSSFKSILEFSQTFKEYLSNEKQQLRILINNAGRNTSGKDAQGLDLLFTTNFLGHFFLTKLLLGSMDDNGRIVNLSSVMHHFSSALDDIESTHSWKSCARGKDGNGDTYSPSKLAAILFTSELNRRKYKDIRSIAVNPGGVNSDIWRGFPAFVRYIFGLVYLTNRQGCSTSVMAAVCSDDFLENNPIPYLQPYHLPTRYEKTPFPLFEMLGPFAGYAFSKPRLPPDNGRKAAEALWKACEELLDQHQ